MSSGTSTGSGNGPASAGLDARSSTYIGTDRSGSCGGEAVDVDALDLGEVALGRVAELAPAPLLGRTQPADDLDVAARRGRRRRCRAGRSPVDEQDPPVAELEGRDDELAGAPPWDRLTTTNCSSGR